MGRATFPVPGSRSARTFVTRLQASRRLGQSCSHHPTAPWRNWPRADIAGHAPAPVIVLTGGTQAWIAAGLPLETGQGRMASEPEDVVLSARERGQGREEAMREYLAWEIDLVNQMATDDDQRFQVLKI